MNETVDCDVLVCGDDADAKADVMHLVEAAGMRGVDAGPLVNAVAVEALTPVLLYINKNLWRQGRGHSHHWRLNLNPRTLNLTALPGIPLVQPGDDLAKLILEALARADVTLQSGDALVVTSKIVSKAEGRIFNLNEIMPGETRDRLAKQTRKDPRIVELVLRESRDFARAPNVLVVEHRLGFVCANAGIDQSNVDGGEEQVLLLPLDPDASARGRCAQRCSMRDGRGSRHRDQRFARATVPTGQRQAWRLAWRDARADRFARSDRSVRAKLQISIQGYADMVASAANLLTGEAAEGLPVVLVRGLNFPAQDGHASEYNRPLEQDLFR